MSVRMWNKGKVNRLLVECRSVLKTAIIENRMEVPKEIINESTIGFSNYSPCT